MIKKHRFWFLEYDLDLNIKDNDYIEFQKNIALHYDPYKKKWVHKNEYSGCWFPATYRCSSLKAAKRHLKKHNEIPYGTKFRLVSEYIGCDLYLTKKEREE